VKVKCDRDGRIYEPDESLERLASYADDPLIVSEVIRPLAQEYGVQPHFHICPACVQDAVDRARDEVTHKPDRSGLYRDVDDTEVGREPDGPERAATTMIRRDAVARRDRGNKSPTEEEAVMTDATPEPAGEQAEAAPKQPSLADQLKEQFEVGKNFVLTATDWKGSEGEIVGIEERRGAPYVSVKLLTYADKRRRPEDKQDNKLVRHTSVQLIDELSPAPAPKVVEEPAPEAVVAE